MASRSRNAPFQRNKKKAGRRGNHRRRSGHNRQRRFKASKKLADEAIKKWSAFNQNEFALLIFKTFKDIKPKLYHHYDDYFAKWKEVFPDKWEELDEYKRNDLLGLVLELGYGRYWLPDKYYDDKPILGCLPAPRTHKKPCDI